MLAALTAVAALVGGRVDTLAIHPLHGRVLRQGTDTPIVGALIRNGDQTALTDDRGGFRFPAAARHRELVVVAIGFRPDTIPIGPSPVVIRLASAPPALAPLVVTAASSVGADAGRVIGALDLALRPRRSSQDLLALAPGLVTTQHAGGGKAEQIFLRGFDADHGTDVAVSVDGVPVNLVSHAHGQGYTDLHFLLPEVVADVIVRKGGHAAEDGNLATAGAVAMTVRDRLDRSVVEARGGSFGGRSAFGLAALGGSADAPGGWIGLADQRTDGPFEARQGFRRRNGMARWTMPLGGAHLALTASGFDAAWSASGQIPTRAVAAGTISRFGAIDSTEGGHTSRYDVWVAASAAAGSATPWRLRAWATRYRLDLHSNFTFFLVDSIRGDGIRQVDRRGLGGLSGDIRGAARVGGQPVSWVAGYAVRGDAAEVSLARQVRRRPGDPILASRIREVHQGLWTQAQVPLGRVLASAGIRGDLFRFGVIDRLGGTGPAGTVWAGRVSPRLGLDWSPNGMTTAWVRATRSFHSNDAREVVQAEGSHPALPAATTAEIGIRGAGRRIVAAASLWATDLESELVLVGDEGVTESSGRTRRVGLDLELRADLGAALWLDGNVSLARGRFRDEPAGADRIPLAPSRVIDLGLTYLPEGPFRGALRVRHVGERPADQTGAVQARGATVAELAAAWRRGAIELRLAVDNVFDVEWNEAQFATTSRLAGERGPVTELHFTPGSPRRLELGIRIAPGGSIR
ncbi:MAG: TonB-dependent receptor [Gemmatimonadetes bacterium]|nr:TonB-dependent receptor [Gemmatimonadota bacterium]